MSAAHYTRAPSLHLQHPGPGDRAPGRGTGPGGRAGTVLVYVYVPRARSAPYTYTKTAPWPRAPARGPIHRAVSVEVDRFCFRRGGHVCLLASTGCTGGCVHISDTCELPQTALALVLKDSFATIIYPKLMPWLSVPVIGVPMEINHTNCPCEFFLYRPFLGPWVC